jgi:hypothetical protein
MRVLTCDAEKKAAIESMGSDLRRFSARDYLLRAGLCILAKPVRSRWPPLLRLLCAPC